MTYIEFGLQSNGLNFWVELETTLMYINPHQFDLESLLMNF